jgi:threonine dehydratase
MTFQRVRDGRIPVHLVAEPFVVQGVQALFAHERLIAEGAGGIAVGALLEGTLAHLPDPLVLLVTGANIDAVTLARVLGS